MNPIEAIEGTVGNLWYHYDVRNDVLYLRKGAPTDTATYAEESDVGFIVVHAVGDDTVVGMTVVSWWKRFGAGGVLPDSLHELAGHVERTTRRLPLAA